MNFFRLSQVAVPFIRMYLNHQLLNRERGPYHRFWIKMCGQMPELAAVDGPLRRRMWHYIFANSMTACWFSVLRGRRLSQKEKEAGWILGIATPLADYLVDHDHLNHQSILEMMNGTSNHPMTGLVQSLHIESRRLNLHPDLFDQYLEKTQFAQSRSLAQSETNSSKETLIDIMYAKGGFALLLYRTALSEEISESETTTIYSLGGLMQFHNDIFDTYRDLQEGIHSLPGSLISHRRLQQLFAEHREKTFQLIRSLPLKRTNKHRFMLLANLALETGAICLDMYARLDENLDVVFDPSKYTREELICDMDKPKNISRALIRTLRTRYALP